MFEYPELPTIVIPWEQVAVVATLIVLTLILAWAFARRIPFWMWVCGIGALLFGVHAGAIPIGYLGQVAADFATGYVQFLGEAWNASAG